jgi:hypothetical protein
MQNQKVDPVSYGLTKAICVEQASAFTLSVPKSFVGRYAPQANRLVFGGRGKQTPIR